MTGERASQTTSEKKIYLGDSVYAAVENGMIKLMTWNGYPDDPRNVIYLDSSVYQALVLYVERITRPAKTEAL